MDTLMLLEYKEKKGQFHYNMVKDHRPQTEADTYGWETIAFTYEAKARVFSTIMDCKLHRREALKQPPYTAEYMRKEWKHFCFVYNYIVSKMEIAEGEKEYIGKHFIAADALAKLGNGHFSDIREDKELSWAWEYDPFNFEESNF